MLHSVKDSGQLPICEVAFIDTGLPDWETLVRGLPVGMESVLLDAETDALTQMSNWASGRNGYCALHLLTHGSPGKLHFKSGVIDEHNIDGFDRELQVIRAALSPEADFLIYSCDLAKGTGDKIIGRLQDYLHVSIAAASNPVGAKDLGGGWELPFRLGQVKTHPLQIAGYQYVMAAPQFVSTAAYVGQTTITLTYDQPLDSANPPPSAFFEEFQGIPGGNPPVPGVVLVNGSTVAISNIQVVGSTIVLTVGTTFTAGDIIDIAYNDHSFANEPLAIQNLAGEDSAPTNSNYVVTGSPPGPSVTSIVEANSATIVQANAGSVTYTVTFSSAVTGVDVSDFALALTGTAQGTVSGISGSGTTYSVTVSGISGDGTMGLNLNSNATGIQDGSSQPIGGGYTGQILTVDHTAPSGPTVQTLSLDTGVLGDARSKDVTPRYTGVAEPDAVVTMYDTDGTTVLGSFTADINGNWGITSTQVTEGFHQFIFKQTDAAGNVSASTSVGYTLDTTAPVNIALSATNVATTGATNGSTIGALSATDASTVTYSLPASTIPGDADNAKFTISGNSLVAAQNLAAGTYSIGVKALDDAGNENIQFFSITVTDQPSVSSIARGNLAPAIVPASSTTASYAVTFDQAVTGVDATDFDLTTTGTASAAIGSVTGSGASYTVTLTGITGDGTIRLDLDSSGTGIVNGTSAAIAGGYTSGEIFTVDHTAPLGPAVLALASGSDSGTLGDGITNDATPTIIGTAEPSATVRLYDTDGTTVLGTTTADGTGNWSITSSTIVEGNHTFTAKQTDAAGNVSPASANFAFRLDTVGPTGTALSRTNVPISSANSGDTVATLNATDASTVTYSFATGNGVIDADNSKFTFSGNGLVASQNLPAGTYNIYVRATDAAGNDALQTLSFTVVNAPSVNSIVRASSGAATAPASANSVTYTVTFDGAVTGVDANDFTLATTGTAAGTIASVSGSGTTYTVTVNAIAGDGTVRLDLNSSGTAIQSSGGVAVAGGYTAGETFTLDHTAPLAPAAFTMNASDDTGMSNTDAITSVNTPQFSGVAEPNATVRLYDTDGTTLLGTTNADGAGNWTITSGTLGDGAHTLLVRQVDAAGNVSPDSATLAVIIDRSTTAPSVPTLAVSSDTGTIGDGRTHIVTPTITGTAEAFAMVTLYDTDGLTPLGTATANANGAWSIVSATLGQGDHSLTVKQVDRAGNASTASATLNLTIDTTAPTAGIAPLLAPNSDSGTPGDGITNVSRPVVIGTAEPNSTITLYDTNGTTILGTAVTNGFGNWSITSSLLSAGSHTLTYTQVDAAGNVSSASAGLNLTIVNPPPPPATTIDGVQVGEATVNLPGGGTGTEITIPIVTSGRAEVAGNPAVADIPLATVGANTLLLAQVGVGYGLTTSGGASQSAGSSLERLIASIIAATPDHPADDQGYLTGNGKSFLGLLPTEVPLLVQTIVPVTDTTATTSSSLTLIGTSNQAQHTALVIDLEGVVTASTINLKDVDFAAIIGAATVTGNTGGQILAGDAADQKFIIDANLNSSIFAGGGADILQMTSAASAAASALAAHAAVTPVSQTILHGGLGADVAVFEGTRSSYNIEVKDAHVIVSDKAGNSNAAHVVNAEALQFADQLITVEHIDELGTIAGLYADVLDRQGDVAGLEFWAGAIKEGLSLGQVALNFISSTEGRTQHQVFNGVAVHDVEVLYEAIFERHSDSSGLAFWVQAMEKGVTLAEVAQGFIDSTEANGHELAATQWDFML